MDIENDLMLAKFMGAFEIDKHKAYISFKPLEYGMGGMEGNYTCNVHDLFYKYSWSWIMPVISKIKTEILKHPKRIDDALITGKIENIYNATVEFIKWHNNRDLDEE